MMNDYSREIWNGSVPSAIGNQSPSRQPEAYHADDGMGDTASSNVPTNDSMFSYKRTLQGDGVLQALCQEINLNAEESRRKSHMEGTHLKPKTTNVHDVIPSGKRKQGEGCEDDQQGILEAFWNNNGRAVLRITLLAAGFVIGPKGQSIRDISDVSGAKIRSWSENFVHHGKMRRVRQIVIEGRVPNIIHALTIIKHAVERYRDLYEGGYCNQFVDPIQVIMGVEFTYSPPPRKAVPYAAGIKTKATRTRRYEDDKKMYRVSNGIMHEGISAVSSESEQSYHSVWPREVTRKLPQVERDDMLGLFETPCDVYDSRSREYCSQNTQGQHAASTYTMFGNHDKGHLHNYPWCEMNTLENSTVSGLDLRPLCTDRASSQYRCNETNNPFASYGYRDQPCRNQPPLWNLEPAPKPRLESHMYDNMFAEFGHKCHVSEKTPQPKGRGLFSRLTPKQRKQDESPVHFTFELTVDSSKGKEAKRKLIFEE